MSHTCSHGHNHHHHGHHHVTHYPSCLSLSSNNPKDCFCEEPLYKRACLLSLLSASVAGVGAFVSGSLALLSDLFHTLFDGMDAFLSLAILKVVRKHPHLEDRVRTWGAAIAFVLLLFVVFGILFEGLHRLSDPEPVNGALMTIGAGANILMNIYVVWFSHKTPEDERTKTHAQLSLHALADLLVSVIALVGGIVVWTTGLAGADGVAAIVVGVYIAWALLPRSYARITQ